MPRTVPEPAGESFRKDAGTRCTSRPSQSRANRRKAYTKKISQEVPISYEAVASARGSRSPDLKFTKSRAKAKTYRTAKMPFPHQGKGRIRQKHQSVQAMQPSAMTGKNRNMHKDN